MKKLVLMFVFAGCVAVAGNAQTASATSDKKDSNKKEATCSQKTASAKACCASKGSEAKAASCHDKSNSTAMKAAEPADKKETAVENQQ